MAEVWQVWQHGHWYSEKGKDTDVQEKMKAEEHEALVQRILETLSFKYTGADSSPVGVLYYFDQYDFSADQWRRIEERVGILARRVQEMRQRAEERERNSGRKGTYAE